MISLFESWRRRGRGDEVGHGNKTRALDGHKQDNVHKMHKSDVLEPKGDRQEMSIRSLGISWPSWHPHLQGSGMSRVRAPATTTNHLMGFSRDDDGLSPRRSRFAYLLQRKRERPAGSASLPWRRQQFSIDSSKESWRSVDGSRESAPRPND